LYEAWFEQALVSYAKFLQKLGALSPYRLVAGLEHVKGRGLDRVYPPTGDLRFDYKPIGSCLDDVVFEEGSYLIGESPGDALRPFFERVYNSCGVERPKP
jgi:hypothetical protein